MRIKINNVKDILNNSKYIPVEVIQDIDKRISDWLATGGKLYGRVQASFYND